MKTLIAAAAAVSALAGSIATPALAAEDDVIVGVETVRYGDLDLDSEDGQRTLRARVAHAARDICGMDERYTGSLIASRQSRTCYADAREQIYVELAAVTGHELRRNG